MEAALDPCHQDASAPALLDGPEVPGGALHKVEDSDVRAPRNWSNNLLDDFFVRPAFSEGAHGQEIRPGDALRASVLC
jgi:hypothetical protein